jgi:hypothetical protein
MEGLIKEGQKMIEEEADDEVRDAGFNFRGATHRALRDSELRVRRFDQLELMCLDDACSMFHVPKAHARHSLYCRILVTMRFCETLHALQGREPLPTSHFLRQRLG